MSNPSSPFIMVCIPAHDEARSISDIIRKTLSYCDEVVVCDDGSVDDTAKVARAAGATVIKHATNKGYGSAIKALFNAAKERNADIMITIDSDGQHNPDQIPAIIEPLKKDQADIVIGSRFLARGDSEQVPLYRTLGIKTITKLSQLVAYKGITDAQSGFRAYSKNALQAIELNDNGMSVSTEILIKAKDNELRIKEVPATISYDIEDTSTHNPFSHGLGVVMSIVRFISIRHPLVFYGIPGLVFLITAGVFATLTVQLYAAEGFFSINKTLLAIGLGIFGLFLVMSGITFYIIASSRRVKP